MSFISRAKKLWDLTKEPVEQLPKPAHTFEEEKVEGIQLKEVFIPRNARDPIKEITEEQHAD